MTYHWKSKTNKTLKDSHVQCHLQSTLSLRKRQHSCSRNSQILMQRIAHSQAEEPFVLKQKHKHFQRKRKREQGTQIQKELSTAWAGDPIVGYVYTRKNHHQISTEIISLHYCEYFERLSLTTLKCTPLALEIWKPNKGHERGARKISTWIIFFLNQYPLLLRDNSH